MDNTHNLSDKEWARIVAGALREETDLFMAIALETPWADHEVSALDYADFCDNAAYKLETLLGQTGKNSRRKLREMRIVLSDSVLIAIHGQYEFLNQWVTGEVNYLPEYPEFLID